ncbi:MAG: peptide-methionine (S)-S-oxide reductase MsrA [Ignavibacteria bacterium]
MTYLIALIFLFSSFSISNGKSENQNSKDQNILTKQNSNKTMATNLDTAVFGAGCFWCVEAVFQRLKGVESIQSGYTGGSVDNPTYNQVSSGKTGHAEVARIIYDPSVISFAELLEVFWTTHNPTTLNKQGADEGTQYRSAIFYLNEDQKAVSEKSKSDVAPQIWDGNIVTEITQLEKFYVAEDYHQNYYNDNSNQSYCKFVINPKLDKFRKKFKDKLKDE